MSEKPSCCDVIISTASLGLCPNASGYTKAVSRYPLDKNPAQPETTYLLCKGKYHGPSCLSGLDSTIYILNVVNSKLFVQLNVNK